MIKISFQLATHVKSQFFFILFVYSQKIFGRKWSCLCGFSIFKLKWLIDMTHYVNHASFCKSDVEDCQKFDECIRLFVWIDWNTFIVSKSVAWVDIFACWTYWSFFQFRSNTGCWSSSKVNINVWFKVKLKPICKVFGPEFQIYQILLTEYFSVELYFG